jgi:Phosphatidylinositolglycan class N (PIG-N)
VRSLQAKLGLPLVKQVAGWLIFGALNLIHIHFPECDICLAFAPLLPFFFPIPKTAEGRLLAYFLSFSPCFVILAIRTEGFFYLSYCMTLYLWTRVETALRQEKMKSGALANDKHVSMWNPMNLSVMMSESRCFSCSLSRWVSLVLESEWDLLVVRDFMGLIRAQRRLHIVRPNFSNFSDTISHAD